MAVLAAFIIECDNPKCEDSLILEVGYGEEASEDDALTFAHEHGFVTVPVDLDGEEWTVDLCGHCDHWRRTEGDLPGEELRAICRAERERLTAAGRWPPPCDGPELIAGTAK